MMNMGDVGPEPIDDAASKRINPLVAIRLLEAPCVPKRVVDPDNLQSLLIFLTHVVLRAREVAVTRQHDDVVAEVMAQGQPVRIRVDLTTALRARRKAVDHDEHSHHTPFLRRRRQPRAAESPPTYWPSGHARARATARALGSRRVCSARHDVIARSNAE